ncbi:hypothetical protein EZV78_03920 [Cutibacterium avidum]|nr:hypothetical protein EZV78_03920 [Cutibacterium avidum]
MSPFHHRGNLFAASGVPLSREIFGGVRSCHVCPESVTVHPSASPRPARRGRGSTSVDSGGRQGPVPGR